jgi:protein FRA10AC1
MVEGGVYSNKSTPSKMEAEASGLGKRTHRVRDEDLDSEFDYAPERKKGTWRDDPIATQRASNLVHSAAVPSKEVIVAERDKEEWRARRYHYLAMDAYSRHKALVNQYLLSCGRGIEHFKRPTDNDRNDYTVLAEEHKFLWEPEDAPTTWEKKLAKAYYDKLFKEYAIADLSRYKENMVAMRWRVEKEVCEGKGQFVCGNKHCLRTEELTSWEVNFAYTEQEERKNALVKLRLCPKCSKKLNYHKKCKRWGKGSKSSKRSKRDKAKKHKKRRKSEKHHSSEIYVSHGEGRSSDSDVELSESGGEAEEKGAESTTEGTEASSSNVWKKPAEAFLEKSKVEEFDDYFKDMLL